MKFDFTFDSYITKKKKKTKSIDHRTKRRKKLFKDFLTNLE